MYISGPISGKPYKNAEAFNKAAKQIEAWGKFTNQDLVPINPIALDLVLTPPKDMEEGSDEIWRWYMRRDIKYLMECDSIVLLKDWEISKGARLEVATGISLGMPIYRFNDTWQLVEAPVTLDLEITPLVHSGFWT